MVMTFENKLKSMYLHGHAAGTVKQCTPANRTNIPVGGAFPPITLENEHCALPISGTVICNFHWS